MPKKTENGADLDETETDATDKRRYPRAELSLLVQYRFDSFDEFLSEYSGDMSTGGMFIRTEDPRPIGSMIYLQFALKDGSKLIEGLGRVVHVTEVGTDRTPGMGVEFVSFDEESIELIEEIVADRTSRVSSSCGA